jgi:hypothetical protein
LSSLRSRRGRRTARRPLHFRGGPGGIAVCATEPHFHDETAAVLHLDGFFWPNRPVCPCCGSVGGKHYDLGKTRVGLRKGSDCRKQFTVKVGTVFASAYPAPQGATRHLSHVRQQKSASATESSHSSRKIQNSVVFVRAPSWALRWRPSAYGRRGFVDAPPSHKSVLIYIMR